MVAADTVRGCSFVEKTVTYSGGLNAKAVGFKNRDDVDLLGIHNVRVQQVFKT